jgi:hypothetical protein
MTSVDATFDGEVVRPDEPLPLPPNARVTVSYVTADEKQAPEETKPAEETEGEPYSFLKAVRAANLQGPPDWSERVDHYLYGTGFDD